MRWVNVKPAELQPGDNYGDMLVLSEPAEQPDGTVCVIVRLPSGHREILDLPIGETVEVGRAER